MSAPISVLSALAAGARHLLRYWPLLVIAFVVNACGALVLTLPGQGLLSPVAYSPGVWPADGSLPIAAIVEHGLALQRNATSAPAAPGVSGEGVLALALGAVLFFAAIVVPTIVLRGGLLAVYREAPAPFSLRRCLWGMWHWLASFGLLWILEAGVTLFVWILALIVTGVAFAAGARAAGPLLGLALALVAMFVWSALTEYARVAGVLSGRRNPFVLLGMGARLLARRPGARFGTYAAAATAGWAVTGLYLAVIGPAAVSAPLAVMIVLQQVVILARLATWLWRLASEVELVRDAPVV